MRGAGGKKIGQEASRYTHKPQLVEQTSQDLTDCRLRFPRHSKDWEGKAIT